MNKALAQFIARHCRLLAIVSLATLIVPIAFLSKGRVDNSIEVWVSDKHQTYADYQDFLQRYGNEEFIVIAANWADPFSDTALKKQRDLAEQIESIPGIEGVMSLPAFADSLSAVRSDWKQFLQDSDLLRNFLLSEDGKTAGMIAWLKPIHAADQRRGIVADVQEAIQSQGFADDEIYVAGTPVMNAALDRGSQESAMRFLPVAIAVAIVMLLWMIRSVSGLIAILCSVFSTALWSVGLMFMAGKSMNMVTVVLPPLLFVLSLAGGIHLVSRFLAFYAAGPDDKSRAIHKTVEELLFPVFLTCLTTGFGFASLMISDMKPVQDFGLFAAIGMIFSFLFNFLILPGVLSFLCKGPGRKMERHLSHWSQRAAALLVYKKTIVVAALLLSGVFALMVTRIKVEANVLGFFPESSKIKRDYRYIAKNLTGLYSVELDVSVDREHAKEVLASIGRLSDSVSSRPEVAKVLHYGVLAEFMRQVQTSSMPVGDKDASRKEFTKFADHYRIKEDGRIYLRMSIFIRAMAGESFKELLPDIHSQADSLFAGRCDYKVTGIVPLVNRAQNSLIQTQVKSLSLAIGVVLTLMGLSLRSMRALLAAIIPNLLPILAIFAFMVFFGIALDSATVMIAGIAIGIAADDTIHFLSQYQRQRPLASSTKEAVEKTFASIGRAVTLTSITAMVGFSILLLAPFKPIYYFGILGSLTMVTAWIGDVVILPACVAVLKVWENK